MSIESHTAFTTFKDLNTTSASSRDASILRSRSAVDAPGFAQVLQAFDSKRDASLSEPVENNEDDAKSDAIAETPEDQQAVQTEEDEAAHADAADVNSARNATDENVSSEKASGEKDTEAGISPTDASPRSGSEAAQNTKVNDNTPRDPQAKPDEPQTSAATTSKQAVSLDLLVNRGDQAKLSMRGLVQSLRVQSSPDLTTIAVQTRTGQIEPPVQPNTPQPTTPIATNDLPEPDVAPPVPHSIGPAGRNPGDSLSDQPPQSGRGPEEPGLRNPSQVPVQQHKNQGEIDPGRVDAQQSRSARADAAQPVVQGRPQVDFTRSGIQAGVTNVAAQNRVEGAMTERAVSAVDTGIGKNALTPLDPQTPKATQLSSTQPESIRASVMAQVQRGLASLLRSSNGNMTLRLTPSHLGTIQISVKRDGDRISLRMTASTPEARDMLEAGGKELMQKLEAKGVKVENFQVDMQPADQPDGSGGASAGFGGERDAAHQQHQGHTTSPSRSGEDVIPLEDPGTGNTISPSESIWSELGLDAIA